jgi:hypothetical protein
VERVGKGRAHVWVPCEKRVNIRTAQQVVGNQPYIKLRNIYINMYKAEAGFKKKKHLYSCGKRNRKKKTRKKKKQEKKGKIEMKTNYYTRCTALTALGSSNPHYLLKNNQ